MHNEQFYTSSKYKFTIHSFNNAQFTVHNTSKSTMHKIYNAQVHPAQIAEHSELFAPSNKLTSQNYINSVHQHTQFMEPFLTNIFSVTKQNFLALKLQNLNLIETEDKTSLLVMVKIFIDSQLHH